MELIYSQEEQRHSGNKNDEISSSSGEIAEISRLFYSNHI